MPYKDNSRYTANGPDFAVPDHTFGQTHAEFIDRSTSSEPDFGASSMPPWILDNSFEDVSYQEVRALPAPENAQAVDLADAPYQEQRRPVSVVQFQDQPVANDFVTVALARSITGIKEVCLVSERSFGTHVRYAIHIVGVQDRSKHVTPITERRDGAEVALDLDFAKVAFEETVKREFPAAKHPSGKAIPTFLNLL